ncbi:MAG: hypothetical protein IPN76_19055 [Saprospiraceae bacterium]|nr:hypothetical protein [Saprospiraceae bacterium]
MKIKIYQFAGLVFGITALLFSCKPSGSVPASWQKFMDCANTACVAEVVAVKDDYLNDPKPLFEEFIKTDERGEDHFVGWLYILRDSVLNNSSYGPTMDRFNMQQALINKSREFENDPKYGTWAKSVIGELELLAIASELEDDIVEHMSITGTYTYELPKNAGSGELKIYPSDDGTVRYAIMVVGPPPAHNQGTMEGKAPFKDNVITITNTDFGGKCVIEITITDGEAVVKTLSGGPSECGFGNNVMADGTYKMVDDLNPFMAEGGDEVPTTLEGIWVSTTDPKSEVAIGNGKYVEIYDTKEVGSYSFRYFKVCPGDCNPIAKTPCIQVRGQDDVCYTVVKTDGKTLELSMIGGKGNTLVYKAKK